MFKQPPRSVSLKSQGEMLKIKVFLPVLFKKLSSTSIFKHAFFLLRFIKSDFAGFLYSAVLFSRSNKAAIFLSITYSVGSVNLAAKVPRGVLPSKRLLGMCRWMGSHFHNWTDYNGVTFLVELLEWGRTFSGFLG